MKCNVTDKNDWNARLYQVVSPHFCDQLPGPLLFFMLNI